MCAELGAPVGIFVPDAVTDAFMASVGITPDQYPFGRLTPGSRAEYARVSEFDLNQVTPMVARPFHPNKSDTADAVAGERIAIDHAAFGSCTNGTREDLLMAALVFHEARKIGTDQLADNRRTGSGKVKVVAYPGSKQVLDQIMLPEPLLGGKSIYNVLVEAGVQVRVPSCGHCFLYSAKDGLQRDEVGIVSFNRNFRMRNGVEGSSSYLSSTYVVASSALLGYIAPPSALGLKWEGPFVSLAA